MERKDVRSGKVSKLRTKLGLRGWELVVDVAIVLLWFLSINIFTSLSGTKGIEDNKSKAIC